MSCPRCMVTCLALALALVGCGGGGTPTGPAEHDPSVVHAMLVLSRGLLTSDGPQAVNFITDGPAMLDVEWLWPEVQVEAVLTKTAAFFKADPTRCKLDPPDMDQATIDLLAEQFVDGGAKPRRFRFIVVRTANGQPHDDHALLLRPETTRWFLDIWSEPEVFPGVEPTIEEINPYHFLVTGGVARSWMWPFPDPKLNLYCPNQDTVEVRFTLQ